MPATSYFFSMPMAPCRLCGKGFYTKPSWIRRGHGFYCSQKCQYQAARKGKMVNCFICGKDVYREPRQLTRSDKYFCSKSCQTQWRNTFFSGSKHANWKGGQFVAYRRILMRDSRPQICALCGTRDVRILTVHHIDENHKNHRIDNLMWLCHNCHFLIHNYDEERGRLMASIA